MSAEVRGSLTPGHAEHCRCAQCMAAVGREFREANRSSEAGIRARSEAQRERRERIATHVLDGIYVNRKVGESKADCAAEAVGLADALMARLDKAADPNPLAVALRNLRNEAHAALALGRPALAEAISETNVRCLELRIAEAETLLASLEGK